MNYIEVLQQLVDGKKVREKCWDKGDYVCIEDNLIVTDCGDVTDLVIDDVEDITKDNWELYQTEEDKLITDGKRWRLIKACTDGGGCEKCERTRKELYKFCKLSMRPFYGALLEITDNKVNELYEKVKGELDA